MVRVVVGASEPSAHGKAVVQSPVLETNVSPGGVGSLTATLFADDGPPFVTVMVYVAVLPGTTLAGPVFVIARSARGVRRSLSVAEFGNGLPVPGGTCVVTVLTSVPRASGATVPVSVKVATAFSGRSTVVSISFVPFGTAQLPPPAAVHVQVALGIPAGSGSWTATPLTALGPRFVTVIV